MIVPRALVPGGGVGTGPPKADTVVEALGADGKVIEGFSKTDCIPVTTDSVRHVLKWRGNDDCHLIQARPIRLRFYLRKAKLYSFTPRIRHKHYVQSYD